MNPFVGRAVGLLALVVLFAAMAATPAQKYDQFAQSASARFAFFESYDEAAEAYGYGSTESSELVEDLWAQETDAYSEVQAAPVWSERQESFYGYGGEAVPADVWDSSPEVFTAWPTETDIDTSDVTERMYWQEGEWFTAPGVPADDCAHDGSCGDPWGYEHEVFEVTTNYGNPWLAEEEEEDEVFEIVTNYGRAEDQPWYIEYEPVRYAGCTYFGTWCEHETETFWSEPYVARSSAQAGGGASTWSSVFYQPLQSLYQSVGGSFGGSSVRNVSAPAPTAPSYYRATTSQAPEPAPRCVINMTPNSAEFGTYVTVTWETENATRAEIDGIGKVQSIGIQGFPAREDRTLTMRVYNNSGAQSTCSAALTVRGAKTSSCTLVANPSRVLEGAPVELRWLAPGALKVEIDVFGPAGTEGTYVVYPSKTTTYRMRVLGPDGTQRTCEAPVQVEQKQPEVWPDPPTWDNSVNTWWR